MAERKNFLIRFNPKVYDALARWAATRCVVRPRRSSFCCASRCAVLDGCLPASARCRGGAARRMTEAGCMTTLDREVSSLARRGMIRRPATDRRGCAEVRAPVLPDR